MLSDESYKDPNDYKPYAMNFQSTVSSSSLPKMAIYYAV